MSAPRRAPRREKGESLEAYRKRRQAYSGAREAGDEGLQPDSNFEARLTRLERTLKTGNPGDLK
ncbi:MAG: hypothetical protein AAFY10_01115 [Pseudomonadota bacterium]